MYHRMASDRRLRAFAPILSILGIIAYVLSIVFATGDNGISYGKAKITKFDRISNITNAYLARPSIQRDRQAASDSIQRHGEILNNIK